MLQSGLRALLQQPRDHIAAVGSKLCRQAGQVPGLQKAAAMNATAGHGAAEEPSIVKVAVSQMTSTSDQLANFVICQQLAEVGPARPRADVWPVCRSAWILKPVLHTNRYQVHHEHATQ